MTEPVAALPYSEYVAAVRREGEALLTAAGQGLDIAVPTCPDWDVEGLVRHVSRVYNRVLHLVADRVTQEPATRPELPDGEPMDVLRDLLDEIVAALSEVDPDTAVWNWATSEPDVAGFWARRMAHESSVHRVDAQRAHGITQPIDAELAQDGMNELLDVLAPIVYRRDNVNGPEGTIVLESSDNGTWYVELSPRSISRVDVTSVADVTARGTTSALLLAAYGRVPWSTPDVEGDRELLSAWSDVMKL